jgi:dihydrolipoamide dehydrogenase
MSESYDLVVIGAGPGGYVSAIRAAQLGLKTALVEKYSTLGGTCLNVGCIPSKALLDSSEHYHNAAHHFPDHGIDCKDLKPNLKKMIERKRSVIDQTVKGIDMLMKKNKIDVLQGVASFISENELSIKGKTVSTIKANKVIIATGSKPANLPFIKLDKKRVITSTEALELQEIPKHMIIIGGGVIGLEIGSVYARLGSKITVVEFLDRIIPNMDKDCSKHLQRSLKKLGFDFKLSTKVTAVDAKAKTVTITAKDKKDNEIKIEGDYALVAIGRRAFTDGLGLDKIGIEVDKAGKIAVDEHLQTKAKGVYAIGDVIEGPMLAHKAEEEGVAVVEYLAGQPFHYNPDVIPGVVYTWPEVASVGKSEEELKSANIAYKAGSFPFKASGRARASNDTDGFVKVLADEKTDEILGVHMLGPRAADMIGECVVAMEYKASAEDIARIVHAHPTFSEAIKEAALAATGNRAIHA